MSPRLGGDCSPWLRETGLNLSSKKIQMLRLSTPQFHYEDRICLVHPTAQTWPHFHLGCTSLQLPSSSCSVGQRSGRVRRWSYDDEDPHQPHVVVLFQCSEADQIHQAVSAGICTAHLLHSRLDYCNVVFAGLVSPTATFSACIPFSTLSCRRRIPVGPRYPFASRSSLASCQAAYWVQAVHDCSSLSARRRTTLLGRPVCRSDQQSRPQILHVWFCHSATYHSATARSLWLLGALGTICRHHYVEFTSLTLSDGNSKHLSLPRLFRLCYFWACNFSCIL